MWREINNKGLPMATHCFRRQRKGAALIMLCLLLGLIFIAIAFSVDVARVQLTQLELQGAADAAARAGAEAMSRGIGTVSYTHLTLPTKA